MPLIGLGCLTKTLNKGRDKSMSRTGFKILTLIIAFFVINLSSTIVLATDHSLTPSLNNIIVQNNAGMPDTVKVVNLLPGDIVKVYTDVALNNKLGQATAISTSATVSIQQLGSGAGSVYITVTSRGKLESDPTIAIAYIAEAKSDAPTGTITVTNNSGMSDKVKVVGLQPGDIVKVYSDAALTNKLGQATVIFTSATVSIEQLGSGVGSVYVTVTSRGKLESDPTIAIAYIAEAKSDAPTGTITVTNNAGIPDTVKVDSVKPGDTVKVYADLGLLTFLGKATVAAGAASATVNIKQLGLLAGTVYVTLTENGKLESDPTIAIAYIAEAKSVAPTGIITVTNNAGIPDTVKVEGLTAGDIVKVYSDSGLTILLGQAAAKGTGTTGIATVSIKQLGSLAGTVYVTLTSSGKGESDYANQPVGSSYAAEDKSDPIAGTITVTNNSGIPDTVKVESLTPGDIVKVYQDLGLTILLGQATVAKGAASATVSVKQLPEAGEVYVTITNTNKCESNGTKQTYGDEIKSPTPDTGDFTVTNNAGISSTVMVDYLQPGDIVKSIFGFKSNRFVWGKPPWPQVLRVQR